MKRPGPMGSLSSIISTDGRRLPPQKNDAACPIPRSPRFKPSRAPKIVSCLPICLSRAHAPSRHAMAPDSSARQRATSPFTSRVRERYRCGRCPSQHEHRLHDRRGRHGPLDRFPPAPTRTIFRLHATRPRSARLFPGALPLPSLHSSLFIPTPEPTIRTGVIAMTSVVIDLMKK